MWGSSLESSLVTHHPSSSTTTTTTSTTTTTTTTSTTTSTERRRGERETIDRVDVDGARGVEGADDGGATDEGEGEAKVDVGANAGERDARGGARWDDGPGCGSRTRTRGTDVRGNSRVSRAV